MTCACGGDFVEDRKFTEDMAAYNIERVRFKCRACGASKYDGERPPPVRTIAPGSGRPATRLCDICGDALGDLRPNQVRHRGECLAIARQRLHRKSHLRVQAQRRIARRGQPASAKARRWNHVGLRGTPR